MSTHNTCFVCKVTLPEPSLTPTICQQIECKIKVEKMVIGKYVLNKIRNNPDMCLFMLRLTNETVLSSRRGHIFNPFPLSMLVPKTNKRDFNKVLKCCQSLLKDWGSIIQTSENLESTDKDLHDQIGEDNYVLLKFILMSSIVNLTLIIKEKGLLIYGVINNDKKEKEFENLRASKGEKSRHFLYHGSSVDNWFSILRNGLRNCSGSKLMTHGSSAGNGIYLSDQLNKSMGYTGLIFPRIVAIVEIAENPKQYDKKNNEFVIQDAKKVIIRFLIVCQNDSADNIIILKNICDDILK